MLKRHLVPSVFINNMKVNEPKKVSLIRGRQVDLIVYDFDGVMTDNKVLVFEDGREAVFCNRSDGLAIQKIKKMGIPQVILSTEKNKVVEARAKKLNIEVIQGVNDKKSALTAYCKKKKYDMKKVVYIGNDINDLEVMKSVGYPLAPLDADEKIKGVARVVIKKKGAEGVVREFFRVLL